MGHARSKRRSATWTRPTTRNRPRSRRSPANWLAKIWPKDGTRGETEKGMKRKANSLEERPQRDCGQSRPGFRSNLCCFRPALWAKVDRPSLGGGDHRVVRDAELALGRTHPADNMSLFRPTGRVWSIGQGQAPTDHRAPIFSRDFSADLFRPPLAASRRPRA